MAKRILILSGLRIFPPQTGGHLRSTAIARALARQGHEVRVYSLAGRREDYGRGLRVLTQDIEPRLTEETDLGLFEGLLQTLARRLRIPRVWQYGLIARGWVPRGLKRHLVEVEVVLCDLPYVPRVPGPWSSKPWLLISHNLEHRLLALGSPRERRFVGWMRGVESRAPRTFDDILPCAPEDQQFFREHDVAGGCALPIVGSAVDGQAYVQPPAVRAAVRASLGLDDDERLIVFSGSRFGPNLQPLADLKAFCASEAAFLARHRLRFLVLGSIEPAAYREGAIIATGRVDEVIPYFAAADAGFNPVTTGSGANVKLFEYLAARLPVLSTRFGVRGTELQPGIDYLEFDTDTLKACLADFSGQRSPAEWRAHAAQVWARHRHYADMDEVVRRATAVLAAFR